MFKCAFNILAVERCLGVVKIAATGCRRCNRRWAGTQRAGIIHDPTFGYFFFFSHPGRRFCNYVRELLRRLFNPFAFQFLQPFRRRLCIDQHACNFFGRFYCQALQPFRNRFNFAFFLLCRRLGRWRCLKLLSQYFSRGFDACRFFRERLNFGLRFNFGRRFFCFAGHPFANSAEDTRFRGLFDLFLWRFLFRFQRLFKPLRQFFVIGLRCYRFSGLQRWSGFFCRKCCRFHFFFDSCFFQGRVENYLFASTFNITHVHRSGWREIVG